MPLMTLADMEQRVWDDSGDFDPINRALETTPGFTDRLINRGYALVRGIQDDRPQFVTPTASGAKFVAQGGLRVQTLLETNYRRILKAWPVSGTSSTTPIGPALERWEPWELFEMQSEDPTQADPAIAFAVWRAGTAVAANVGLWNFGVWRLPTNGNTFYTLSVLREVSLLVNATDKPDCSEEESCWACDVASVIAAGYLGQSEEWIARIAARLPEELQAAAGQVARELSVMGASPTSEPA